MNRGTIGAFLIGAVVGVVLIIAASGGDPDEMTFGDGVFNRYVAQHLTTPPEDIDPVVLSRGVSYRYGRIGVPAILWLASAGRHEAMRWVQPLLMVASAGALAAAGHALFPRFSPWSALAPFAALGLALTISGGFAEPVSAACLLWAVLLIRDERWWPAAGLLTVAMLTRETAAIPILGMLIWVLAKNGRRWAATLAASFLPVVAWHLFVAARFGKLPLLDPWLTTAGSSPIPFRTLWGGLTGEPASLVLLMIVHILLGVVGIMLARDSLLGAAAAASVVQLLWAPRDTYRYLGDTSRVLLFLELFVILALVHRVYSRAERRVA